MPLSIRPMVLEGGGESFFGRSLGNVPPVQVAHRKSSHRPLRFATKAAGAARFGTRTGDAQPEATKPQNPLKMGEQISTDGRTDLDAFTIAARLLEGFGVSESSGGIASVFIDAARDFPLLRLRAAFELQRARAAIGTAPF
jgi:hypothetical protein